MKINILFMILLLLIIILFILDLPGADMLGVPFLGTSPLQIEPDQRLGRRTTDTSRETDRMTQPIRVFSRVSGNQESRAWNLSLLEGFIEAYSYSRGAAKAKYSHLSTGAATVATSATPARGVPGGGRRHDALRPEAGMTIILVIMIIVLLVL